LNLAILYDEPQEARWFRRLDPRLRDVDKYPITGATRRFPAVAGVLEYDRPDIVLLADGEPVLVVEETVEVPSGHNVGQRFARLAAAAEQGVPVLYFGPYAAMKHGGETAGPRYVNLRLFYALEALEDATGTAITTINWPVDDRYELLRGRGHDDDVREYVTLLLDALEDWPDALSEAIVDSDLRERLRSERAEFIDSSIVNPDQYLEPPPSLDFWSRAQLAAAAGVATTSVPSGATHAVYKVGMRKMRSDPYTGMAMLYRYLYLSTGRADSLVLRFPHIDRQTWHDLAQRGRRKDIRLYRHTADAIWFSDGLLLQGDL